jgi:predicted RNA-binding Zn ribbon-like protein
VRPGPGAGVTAGQHQQPGPDTGEAGALGVADPPGRLTGTAARQRILRATGDDERQGTVSWRPGGAARLRADLDPVFAATTIDEAVNHLDPLMRGAVVPPAHSRRRHRRLGLGCRPGGNGRRLLAALADHLVRRGTTRPGVCHAGPCRCVYADRSRARTRRYCCGQCNVRAAAAADRQ